MILFAFEAYGLLLKCIIVSHNQSYIRSSYGHQHDLDQSRSHRKECAQLLLTTHCFEWHQLAIISSDKTFETHLDHANLLRIPWLEQNQNIRTWTSVPFISEIV
jgi:hypothetical protein